MKISIIDKNEIKNSWLHDQDRLRIKLELPKRFDSFIGIKIVRDRLNRSNFESEVEFEKKIRKHCRKKKVKGLVFNRNYPILNSYFGDFVNLTHKVIIEIDGGYHANPEQVEKDNRRDGVLKMAGWTVFRVRYPGWKGLDRCIDWIAKKYNPHEWLDKKKQNRKLHRLRRSLNLPHDKKTMAILKNKQLRKEAIKQQYIKAGVDITKFPEWFGSK